MPQFEPFRGIRYDPARVALADVTAPPYDVIDEELRAQLVQRHPLNAVRIDLPAEEHGRDRYDVATCLLDEWRRDGILVQDSEPAYYVYAMGFTDDGGVERQTLGVIGSLELVEPGEGGVLPHEETTPKARSDRLQMLRCCRANLSAVWGLSPAAGLSGQLDLDTEPLADWTDDEGVRHRLWRCTDADRIAAISELVGSEPVLIADGHHRYETSLAYRDERHAAGDGAGPHDSLMLFVVELAEDQLCVRPIHRLIGGVADPSSVRAHLERSFELTPLGPTDRLGAKIRSRMDEEGFLVLVLADESFAMHPRAGVFADVRDLDTSRLDHALTGLSGHELVYQHGVDAVVQRVRKGDAAAGVLLRPARVEQILEISHGGTRMPPKTTFFHPKPRTGLVFRSLDEADS